jgi:predicted DNA-binding transcriptional regulator AlpA
MADDPVDHDGEKGRVLYLPEIMARTGMPEGTIRSRYHAGTMTCLWKLGRRLVTFERDLDAWLRRQQEATTKTKDGSAPIGEPENMER